MRPAGSLAEPGRSIGGRGIELGIALVAVGLENAARVPEMVPDMVFLPIRCKGIDGTRWGGSRPGSLVANVSPDAALLHALAQALLPQGALQDPDWRIIGMQQIARHDLGLDPVGERLQHLHGASAPLHQRAVGNISPHAGEDLVQGKRCDQATAFKFGRA